MNCFISSKACGKLNMVYLHWKRSNVIYAKRFGMGNKFPDKIATWDKTNLMSIRFTSSRLIKNWANKQRISCMCSAAPWVMIFGYLYVQEYFSCDKMSTPFMLVDVKCHTYWFGVQSIYYLDLTVNWQLWDRVSADQYHKTVLGAQVNNYLRWHDF